MSQIDYLNEELLDQLERLGNKNLIGEAMKAELTRSQGSASRRSSRS